MMPIHNKDVRTSKKRNLKNGVEKKICEFWVERLSRRSVSLHQINANISCCQMLLLGWSTLPLKNPSTLFQIHVVCNCQILYRVKRKNAWNRNYKLSTDLITWNARRLKFWHYNNSGKPIKYNLNYPKQAQNDLSWHYNFSSKSNRLPGFWESK